jgi:hypothetical protein
VSFSYDLTTSVGQVRLLADDRTPVGAVFSDEELGQLLVFTDQRVRLAAAQALDLKAANRAWIQRITAEGVATDGAAIAAALAARAKELRRQEAEGGEADADAGFDIAEVVTDDFSLRQVLTNRFLREQS